MTEKDTVTVSVDVINTGDRFGIEIVQLYIADKTGAARRPLRELKGYEKVALQPGETKTVTMAINYRSLAWYSTQLHDWYAASGEYEILIGASSRDIRLNAALRLNNSQLLPLYVTKNTTMGELLADPRTASFIKEWQQKLLDVFAPPEEAEKAEEPSASEEAVSDEMNNAMMYSMPLRNLVTFGTCTPARLEEMICSLNEIL